MGKLPVILKREPLMEAVCEVRFADAMVSEILPGTLVGKLATKPQLHRMPTADIPRPLRVADPNLAYAPVFRLSWDQYSVGFGDRSISVGCARPYPKWPAYKKTILEIFGHLQNTLDHPVERYSLKYVNVLEEPSLSAQVAKIKMSISVGDTQIKDQQLNLRVEMVEAGTIHVVTIITGAVGQTGDKKQFAGVVVDVDSIRTVPSLKFGEFFSKMEGELEGLRLSNKRKFFSCLTEEAIEEMGPVYE